MSIPFARDPWNEIIPNLWQGGLYYHEPTGWPCHPTDQFGLVVSMDPKWDTGPDCGVPHWRCRIPDGVLSADERCYVDRTVERVLRGLDDGLKTLVRCRMGYNRSGLVVALVLLARGWTANEAIGHIRRQRSEWALCNRHFTNYIRERAENWAGAR